MCKKKKQNNNFINFNTFRILFSKIIFRNRGWRLLLITVITTIISGSFRFSFIINLILFYS